MPKLDHAKKIIKSQSMVEVIDKYRSFEVGIKALEVDNSLFFNLLVLQHFE